MLAECPHAQLLEWIAYAEVEPFGEERGDVRAAMLAATTYNIHRGRRTRARSIEDFMPFRAAKPRGDRMTPAKTAMLKNFLGVRNA